MQGFDVTNQMTIVNRQHQERLAEAQREQLVRAARDQRAGARFDAKLVPAAGRQPSLLARLRGLARPTPAHAG